MEKNAPSLPSPPPSSPEAPHVAILVLSTNARSHLPLCLSSMSKQTYPHFTIYLIDNLSTDGTEEYVRTAFPHVVILKTPKRVCYRRGNNVGMRQIDAPFVVISNEDVEVEEDWLEGMMQEILRDPHVGIVTPKILLFEKRDTMNSAGNLLHYTGLTSNRGNRQAASLHTEPCDLATISGCCFLIRGELLRQLDGFSDDFDALESGYYASYEDVDLSWRSRLLGWKIRYAPRSVMYHKWLEKPISPQRFASYEWGRILVLLRNLEALSFLRLAPALLLAEAMTWGYAALRGWPWLRGKLRIGGWLLTHPRLLWAMRQKVQALRRCSDAEIFQAMETSFPFLHILPPSPSPLYPFLQNAADTLFSWLRPKPRQAR